MPRYNSYFNSENLPFQRIIVNNADGQTKVGCACCCYAEVRSVTASLSHVGYLPFTCEGESPPNTNTRYLKYRASGDGYLEACGLAPRNLTVTQEWTVDPFTGLTCYNGPCSDIVSNGCSELQNCSATRKSYSCAFEGGSINWTESLQDSYTIENVASNVDTVLGRINPYGNDGMPAGTRGSVINGTNGSILTWVNDCALNRAEYTSGSGGVTKTKLFVKFTKATQYTLTQSNGSVQTLEATVGQEITVDPPTEPNTWTDIAIVNKTKVGCCNSSIGATTHIGQTTDSTFVPDEESPSPLLTPLTGPDCKKYLTVTTHNSSNRLCGASDGGYSASYSNDTNLSTTSTITQNGIITTDSSSNNVSYNHSITANAIFGDEQIQLIESVSSFVNTTSSNGESSCDGSNTVTASLGDEPPFYEYTCNPCTDSNCTARQYVICVGESISCTTTISGPTIVVSCGGTGQLSEEDGGSYSSSYSSTSTTIYSGLVTSQDQLQTGTWEDETSPNESLCASRAEGLTTKTRSNVAAAIALNFTAPASETPVTYEHWFHYYTVEVDNSEEGCPTSDVVAHNEKWTSVSSGGVLTLSRNINLSTPPKNHSICAQGLAFVTRVA